MQQLVKLFPKKIDSFFDPFVGGGSTFLNTSANRYYVNDIDSNLIELHKTISAYSRNQPELYSGIFDIVKKYGLSCSYKDHEIPLELKKTHPKTYYAVFNKPAYMKLRDAFNTDNKRDYVKLYILLIYGFNRILRFNKAGKFNLPVGNVDFNNNVVKALNYYLDFCAQNTILFNNFDYTTFLNQHSIKVSDFVYFDPPYLISASEYNKIWNENKEKELYSTIDKLDKKGIKFGLSNILNHKGMKNLLLEQWSKKYNVYTINSNYISFNDNSIKNDSKEIYVTNYVKKS